MPLCGIRHRRLRGEEAGRRQAAVDTDRRYAPQLNVIELMDQERVGKEKVLDSGMRQQQSFLRRLLCQLLVDRSAEIDRALMQAVGVPNGMPIVVVGRDRAAMQRGDVV